MASNNVIWGAISDIWENASGCGFVGTNAIDLSKFVTLKIMIIHIMFYHQLLFLKQKLQKI